MFGNYLKMAWKVLGRRRFFTFVSLFGIGFTLTALMVVVAVVDSQVAPGYPEAKLKRTLSLSRMSMSGDRSRWSSGPGYRFVDRYARDLPGVELMSVGTTPSTAISFRDGRKLTSRLRHVDAAFWRIMDFEFREGAAFTARDDSTAARVAVISESTRRRFFGDRPALGEDLELDGRSFRVAGVVRDVPPTRLGASADIWLPLRTVPTAGFFDAMIGGGEVLYLLETDVRIESVQDAFRERLTRIEFPDPERFHTMTGLPMTRLEQISATMLNLDRGESAPRKLILFILLGMLAFMLLPAINLININMSRIYERSGEIGVRKAFGAAGGDLVLQFVVENVVLSLIGGAIGLVGAFVVFTVAGSVAPSYGFDFSLNWRIFLAAFALAIVFGLLSGVWPAWKMSRQHPVDALRGGAS